MFSYFNDGIKQTNPTKTIDIADLVNEIKNNPQVEKINKIIQLKSVGDKSYKDLKITLPNITPNCVVRKREITKNPDNILVFSQYVYIDFDLPKEVDVIKYKKDFIENYKSIVSVVALSSTQGGISVIIKVKNSINKDNFKLIRDSIIDTYFSNELKYIDTVASDIGRAMFIGYDPDVYYNIENSINVKINTIKNKTTRNELKKRV